jgi:tetratricopeptide (TPR) repeat protein
MKQQTQVAKENDLARSIASLLQASIARGSTYVFLTGIGFVVLATSLGPQAVAHVISKEWGKCSGGEGANPDVIIAGCTAVIDADDDPPRWLAIALNNRGVAFKAKGEFDHALQDYNLSLLLDPYSASHYNNRGVIYRTKGDLERAIQEYGKAIALKPDYIAAYYNRALAHLDMNQLENALADFNAVLQANPHNEYALYGRGLLKQKMGDQQGAVADMAAAQSKNPEIAREFDRPRRK